MLKPQFKINHLLVYRIAFILGIPMALVCGLALSGTGQESAYAVYSRYLLACLCGLSVIMTSISQTWRHNIGEFSLVIGYVFSAHVASVVFDQHVSLFSAFYSIAGLSLLAFVFHKISLILALQIPALVLLICTAYLTPAALLSPHVFAMVSLTICVVSTLISANFLYARSLKKKSEIMSNLWFDQGADAMVYGHTATAEPIRVNPMAYKLFATSDANLVVSLLQQAFANHHDADTLADAARLALVEDVWSDTVKFTTAEGKTFWGNIAMRRLFVDKNDYVFVRIADVSAQVRHEIDLQTAKKIAEESVTTRTRFLANMSHEIRTPMNGVIGMTSLMMETELDSHQRSYLNTIRSSGESLLNIINEILDFSKIDADQVELEQQAFDLELCVSEAIDMVAPAAAKKGLELLLQFNVNHRQLWIGDVTRIRQILVNLLSNAVKFTHAGEVTVQVSSSDDDDERAILNFTVIDSGVGIAPHQLGKLFDPFVQADLSTTRKYGGTGLGLSICKGLVDLMQGTITAASKPGIGSQFTFDLHLPKAELTQTDANFTFPEQRAAVCQTNAEAAKITGQLLAGMDIPHTIYLDASQLLSGLAHGQFDLVLTDLKLREEPALAALLKQSSKHQRVVNLQTVGERIKPSDYMHMMSKPLRPSTFERSIANLLNFGSIEDAHVSTIRNWDDLPLDGLSFLLAEDNAVNQKVAVQILKKLGVRVDVVGNGKEAVEMMTQRNYDYVFMDVQMPEIDGLEATQLIRLMEDIRQPYIIAMTANAMDKDKQVCLEIGMNDFIAKPIRLEHVYNVLKKALNNLTKTG
ncbi:MAG: signal transduction histidine kinase/CheY-like chemotaxis protein [Candidatus Pseudothioglobus sp.]|jgi:signal transduction histidine kinase/CheY-like chemotaxis protein